MTELSLHREMERESACLGKDKFPSEESAEAWIVALRKWSDNNKRHQLSSYRCVFCSEWHIGH